MSRKLFEPKRFAIYSDAESSLQTIEIHKERKKSGGLTSVLANNGASLQQLTHPQISTPVPLDFESWLPFSAPHYHISSDPNDYTLTPVIIMPSDLPNRNAIGFPLKELVKFHPHLGMQAYKTWKGKPTHLEHQNQDITKAYGVIVDSFLHKMTTHGGGKVWKVMHLLAFDRSKHPEFVSQVLSGEYNSYSMGAWVESYTCSYCNNKVGSYECSHLDPKKKGEFYEKDGRLVFNNVCNIEGFECSGVADPAYVSAISEHKFSFPNHNVVI